MAFEEIISSAWFRHGVFPLLSALAGVLLKCATRNDQYAFFKKEDMAVGPQLMLSAALTFVVVTTDRARALVTANAGLKSSLLDKPLNASAVLRIQGEVAAISQKMMGAAYFLLALILVLWGTTTLVKRWGWKSEAELRPLLGIGIPLGIGVLSLAAVMTAVQP